MKLRKQIFTGIGALAFMVLLALNVQLVKSNQKDVGMSKLSLYKISVIAQSGSETKCNSIEDCPADMISLTYKGKVYCCNKPDPVDTGHWDDVPTLD